MDYFGYKPVSYSRTTITELMIPSYANFGGKIHGGILLSLMDKVAYACASKHAGNYCVTVSVDNVDFLQPVDVGDLVSLNASVHYVGKTSLVIGIQVIAENVTSSTVKHTNTSYFTMVAKGDDNKTREVPGLILETRSELKNYIEAIKRKEAKFNYKQTLEYLHDNLDIDEELSKLKNERCKVGLPD
ncbi:acyl-CoA thioesterase [Cytophagaceae bacterium ABcell3]|nr:acyl-CoA thioesterase [Cytophagaceae bacterium ABcell3]